MAEGQKFRRSLAARSVLALVLFAGYYVLAFAVAGLLLLVPYAGARLGLPARLYVWALYVVCAGAACLILWSAIPRPGRFLAPGVLLTPESEPRLFGEIFKLARELGQKPPKEVYLALNVTAWVGGRGGFMGIGSRRVVAFGLPVLEALSINEFRAVLAHEFGHFSGGDTRIGRLIHMTRSTIGRTIEQLPALSGLGKRAAAFGELVRLPFVLYGNWFMRLTQAVSRRQEYLADELSASTVGRETAISTQREMFIAELMQAWYWASLLEHALNAGYLPPFAAGFGEFAGFGPNRELALEALNWHIEHVRSGLHDSHPSLEERIRALEALPAGRAPEPAPRAISLLEDVPRRERELFTFLSPEAGPKLKPIVWDDVTPVALVPYWAKQAKIHGADLAGLTPKGLVDRLPGLAEWGRQMSEKAGIPPSAVEVEAQAKSYAASVIGTAIVTKLIVRGWQASGGPGRYTVLRLGDLSWEPFRVVKELAEGKTAPEDWLRLCEEMGIADLELGSSGQGQEGEAAAEPEPAISPMRAPGAAPAPREGGGFPKIALVLGSLIVMALLATVFWGDRSGFIDEVDFASQFVFRPPASSPPARYDLKMEEPARPSLGTGSPFSLARYGADLVAGVARISSGKGSYEVEGTVVNRSDKTYHFVMVRVEFLDALGKVAGALQTAALRDEYILPSGVKTFKVRGTGAPPGPTARAKVVYSVEAK